MAESQDDKTVDQRIKQMRALLDELEAAQQKDVTDETSEENKEVPVERQREQARSETSSQRVTRVRAHLRALKARQQDQQ